MDDEPEDLKVPIPFVYQFTGGLRDRGPVKFEITAVETWPKWDGNRGGICLHWSGETGFGEATLLIGNDGKPVVDSETYGKGFVLAALTALLEAAGER